MSGEGLGALVGGMDDDAIHRIPVKRGRTNDLHRYLGGGRGRFESEDCTVKGPGSDFTGGTDDLVIVNDRGCYVEC